MNTDQKRKISLTLRGFSIPSAQLSTLVGVKPTLLGDRGDLRGSRGAKLRTSFVLYERGMQVGEHWDDAVEALIESLGGDAHIAAIMSANSVEMAHISVLVPARSSEEQESGYVSASSMQKILKIGASFGVEIT